MTSICNKYGSGLPQRDPPTGPVTSNSTLGKIKHPNGVLRGRMTTVVSKTGSELTPTPKGIKVGVLGAQVGIFWIGVLVKP